MRCTVLALLAITFGANAEDCKGQARFDKIMCESHMCTMCVLEYCTLKHQVVPMAPSPVDGLSEVPECWPPPLTEEEEALRRRAGRLLESLRQIPKVCSDLKAWENEHESTFALFRRGCLDGATTGVLEAPVYSNRQIEYAWLFLFEMHQKHPNRRKHTEECAAILGVSYNWSMPLRGSCKIQTALAEMPSTSRKQILEAAVAHDILKAIQMTGHTSMQTIATQDQQPDSHVVLYDRPLFANATTTSSSPVKRGKGCNGDLVQQRHGSLNPFVNPRSCSRSATPPNPLSTARNSPGIFSEGLAGPHTHEFHAAGAIPAIMPPKAWNNNRAHVPAALSKSSSEKLLPAALPQHPSDTVALGAPFHTPSKPNPNNPFRTNNKADMQKKLSRDDADSQRSRIDFDYMYGPFVNNQGC